ncbi:hypothetical protein SK128_012747 [Halocaridina rubra]|uniref:Uncharacterized protein n=1 Tax=Halocaridina rubra TaxID=373956 RepID=A0AAN9A4K0_HALRR
MCHVLSAADVKPSKGFGVLFSSDVYYLLKITLAVTFLRFPIAYCGCVHLPIHDDERKTVVKSAQLGCLLVRKNNLLSETELLEFSGKLEGTERISNLEE